MTLCISHLLEATQLFDPDFDDKSSLLQPLDVVIEISRLNGIRSLKVIVRSFPDLSLNVGSVLFCLAKHLHVTEGAHEHVELSLGGRDCNCSYGAIFCWGSRGSRGSSGV